MIDCKVPTARPQNPLRTGYPEEAQRGARAHPTICPSAYVNWIRSDCQQATLGAPPILITITSPINPQHRFLTERTTSLLHHPWALLRPVISIRGYLCTQVLLWKLFRVQTRGEFHSEAVELATHQPPISGFISRFPFPFPTPLSAIRPP